MTKRKNAESTSPEAIAAALASIDTSMEHATTAGVVDHGSQIGSWTPPEVAEEQLVEQVVQELEAEADGVVDQSNEPNLADDLLAVAGEDVDLTVTILKDEIDQREAFQLEKDPDNANIQRTLKKVRSQMVTKRAARLLLATNVDPAFINREVHSGSKYNVYALGKLADLIYGVTDGVVANAINIACMKSLFSFKRAEVPFSMEAAKGACSKDYARTHIDAAIRKHLISHTVAKSTAPTQASSTMQALVTLGVVSTSGGGKNPLYFVRDTPIARKIEDMVSKMEIAA